MLRQKIDFLSVAILITKVVLLSNSILVLSLSLCSEAHGKGKWDPKIIIIVALLAI
jgi:hypothetical protein